MYAVNFKARFCNREDPNPAWNPKTGVSFLWSWIDQGSLCLYLHSAQVTHKRILKKIKLLNHTLAVRCRPFSVSGRFWIRFFPRFFSMFSLFLRAIRSITPFVCLKPYICLKTSICLIHILLNAYYFSCWETITFVSARNFKNCTRHMQHKSHR